MFPSWWGRSCLNNNIADQFAKSWNSNNLKCWMSIDSCRLWGILCGQQKHVRIQYIINVVPRNTSLFFWISSIVIYCTPSPKVLKPTIDWQSSTHWCKIFFGFPHESNSKHFMTYWHMKKAQCLKQLQPNLIEETGTTRTEPGHSSDQVFVPKNRWLGIRLSNSCQVLEWYSLYSNLVICHGRISSGALPPKFPPWNWPSCRLAGGNSASKCLHLEARAWKKHKVGFTTQKWCIFPYKND